MKILTSIIACFVVCISVQGQDYASKPIASIHHYAERLLGHKIVDKKEEVDLRKDKLYYYKEKNLPGHYLHVSGGRKGDYFLAMWKLDDGNDLVAITHYNCQAWCVYELSCYSFSKHDSTEVSSKIFPLSKMTKHMSKIQKKVLAEYEVKDKAPQFKFILPKNQGLLKVHISMERNVIEFPLLDLEWNGSKFEIKTKYKEIPDL